MSNSLVIALVESLLRLPLPDDIRLLDVSRRYDVDPMYWSKPAEWHWSFAWTIGGVLEVNASFRESDVTDDNGRFCADVAKSIDEEARKLKAGVKA